MAKATKKTATNSNNPFSETALNQSVQALAAKVSNWEQNEEQASNGRLHQILQDVYSLYLRYDGDTAWSVGLTKYLEKVGRPVNNKMTLMGKIVRAVFDENRRDVTPLVGALRIAKKNNVEELQIANWLTTNGGCYQVRKNPKLIRPNEIKDEGALDSRSKAIIKAENSCKAMTPLVSVPEPKLSVPDFATDTHGSYVIALATTTNGKLNVLHFTHHKAMVENYLERLGKSLPNAKDGSDVAVPSTDDIEASLAGKRKSAS